MEENLFIRAESLGARFVEWLEHRRTMRFLRRQTQVIEARRELLRAKRWLIENQKDLEIEQAKVSAVKEH